MSVCLRVCVRACFPSTSSLVPKCWLSLARQVHFFKKTKQKWKDREEEKPRRRSRCAAWVEAKVQFKAHNLQIRDGYGFYFSSPPPTRIMLTFLLALAYLAALVQSLYNLMLAAGYVVCFFFVSTPCE